MRNSVNNKTNCCFTEKSKVTRNVLVAIFFLSAGVILLLRNFGIISYDIIKYIFSWQSLLIAFGLLVLSNGFRKKWFKGFILISIGAIFLIDEIYGLKYGTANLFWPIILIFIGILIVVKIFTRSSNIDKKNTSKYSPLIDELFSSNDYINISRVFSGVNTIITSQNFKGGKVSFVFGGGELDFRGAALSEGINILKVECVFGGVKIILPENWDVSLETSGVFGGFSDERRYIKLSNVETKGKLIIKGEAVFGGGEIING
ncbi:MAG TPA: DUF5668 domain-containing protein [Bacteroidales bacterium]|jgi:predicted membrane protein|nr:DUF5668 domain-containing protein [Bacteroidales bacterium]HOL97058.1 DUF5668 domain-containing protein [Bacteroidales bacterium]HOM35967.1 DUF5668 domain-containing protein [Bacteroidales bacterium]HPD23419.1 DUF5668 domain-containing protein [Bacteroidales bacterium]HRS99413.1 DUF5668 domain-containing protein [Bacteroidales bacterium]